ncbi:MAG: hypothetical protein AB1445_06160 [Bacillota bacterium]
MTAAAFSLVITALILPTFIRLTSHVRLARVNFTGRTLPSGTGLAVVMGAGTGTLLATLAGDYCPDLALALLVVLAGFGLVGLVDDVAGEVGIKGWKGHLRSLLEEARLTTGGLKVLFGVVVALTVAVFVGGNRLDVGINAGLMAVGAATLNQLDTKPARAVAGFLAFTALAALAGGTAVLRAAAPVVGAVLAYLPYDAGARAMLGDSGSNPLGAALGLALVRLPLPVRVAALAILVVLHVAGEVTSLDRLLAAGAPGREGGQG